MHTHSILYEPEFYKKQEEKPEPSNYLFLKYWLTLIVVSKTKSNKQKLKDPEINLAFPPLLEVEHESMIKILIWYVCDFSLLTTQILENRTISPNKSN